MVSETSVFFNQIYNTRMIEAHHLFVLLNLISDFDYIFLICARRTTFQNRLIPQKLYLEKHILDIFTKTQHFSTL